MKLRNTLDSTWYLDPHVYERERDRIFKSSWWLLGPLQNVSNPGEYVCDRICGWPVFVVRSSDGVLRAFLNVCRHRGASLLACGSGRIDTIRCPYHGWLYDDHGRLLKAPHFSDESSLDCAQFSLIPIHVEVWNDLVFISIEPKEGISLKDWLGEVATLSEAFPGPADLEYHGHFDVSGELNWKLYCDNTVEAYHLNLVHPRLGHTIANGEVNLYSVNDGYSVIFDVTHGNSGDGLELRGRKGMWVYHFPGLQLVLGEKVFKAERVDATGPQQICSKNWAWYSDLSTQETKKAFQWARQIVEEDFGICKLVTANMKSGVFVPGPLSPKMEKHVIGFQQIIRNQLESDELM